MNSKKIVAAFCFVVIQLSSKAQIPFSYSNGSFNLTTPSINRQVINGQTCKTRVFLETGDGGFMQFLTNGYQQQPFTKGWYFKSSASIKPLVQLNMIYDTIRRPPHASAFTLQTTTDNLHNNPAQNILSATDRFIALTSSVVTVVPGDTMTMAITYKNTPQPNSENICSYNRSVIAFFYNAGGINNLFSPLDGNTQYNFNGTWVNAIRKDNNSNIVSLSSLPPQVQAKLNSTGYSQALYISVPYVANGPEKNIFFSLAPNADTLQYSQLSSSVKAVIVDYNSLNADCNSGATLSEIANQDLSINFASGDPNYIITAPSSFKQAKDFINKDIRYHVHFENLGAGNADSVAVEVTIPDGISYPASNQKIFYCSIGNVLIPVYKEGSFVPVNKKARACYYRLNLDSRIIYFKIKNANLKGTIESNGINDEGDIWFKLGTGNPQPQQVHQCMLSVASIKFDANPVITNTSMIRVGISLRNACPPVIHDPHRGD